MDRAASLHSLLGAIGQACSVRSPFACDYGVNTRIGQNGFRNFGCVFLDCNFIIVGQEAQDRSGKRFSERYPRREGGCGQSMACFAMRAVRRVLATVETSIPVWHVLPSNFRSHTWQQHSQ
jgi:hypothetical protein